MVSSVTIYGAVPVDLSTIRLLRLPSRATPFDYELIATPLADLPSFKALSYTWGDPSISSSVLVNGERLPITKSLYQALQALQQYHETLWWIDQICIDQSSLEDKGKQVPLMEKIYSRAESTVSWLGVATLESERAMDYLQEAGAECIALGMNELPIIAEGLMQLQVDIPLQDPKLETRFPQLCEKMDRVVARWGEWQDLDVVTDVLALFANSYFTRGWIKQELSIPKKLMFQYGPKTLGIEEFQAGFILFQAHYTYSQKKFDLLGKLDPQDPRNEIRRKFTVADDSHNTIHPSLKTRECYQSGDRPDEMPLERLLRRFGSKVKFSDPRDYIYGFLGLARDSSRLSIPVDYTRPWEQVHTLAMKKMIKNESIHMLEHVQYPKASEKLPSWVPDFSSKQYWSLTDITITSDRPFCASGNTKQSIIWSTETSWAEESLQVRGWVVDTITKVGHPWDKTCLSRGLPNLFGALPPCSDITAFCEEAVVLHEQHPDLDIYISKERLKEATWKVPILDHEYIATQQKSQRASHQSAEGYQELEQGLGWGIQILIEGKPVETVIPLLSEHREQLRVAGLPDHGIEADKLRLSRQMLSQRAQNYYNGLEALESRRPFLTKKGFVGIGPLRMEQGDVIAVFAGSKVPFVLRPISCGGTSALKYNLVGEAYCHGLMDGEVVAFGLQERDIILT